MEYYKIKDSTYTQTAFINYSNNTSTNKFYITYLFFLITTKTVVTKLPCNFNFAVIMMCAILMSYNFLHILLLVLFAQYCETHRNIY